MAGNCAQNDIDYKKRLFAAVARLHEEEDKFQKEAVALRNQMQQAGQYMRKQFSEVEKKICLLYEEDKTLRSGESDEATSNENNAGSRAGSTESSSSTMKMASSQVLAESDKLVQQMIVSLADLHRDERLVLTDKLIKELKKLRIEDKKADKGQSTPSRGRLNEYFSSAKETKGPEGSGLAEPKKEQAVQLEQQQPLPTVPPQPVQPVQPETLAKPQLANGEITTVPEGCELKATDSFITTQMLKEANPQPQTKQPEEDIKTAVSSTSTTTAASASSSTATAVETTKTPSADSK